MILNITYFRLIEKEEDKEESFYDELLEKIHSITEFCNTCMVISSDEMLNTVFSYLSIQDEYRDHLIFSKSHKSISILIDSKYSNKVITFFKNTNSKHVKLKGWLDG